MMKIFIGFLLALIILAGGAFWGYQILVNRQYTTTNAAPFTNPFAAKPSSSFSSTSAVATNPFSEPTPENPFGATGSGQYQNPFETLK